MNQTVIDKITKHYLESGDFNGYPVYALKKKYEINDESAKALLRELILSRKIDVVFGNIHPNPHIKAFSDTSAEQQIEFLEQLEFVDHFCLYPSKETLSQFVQRPDYSSEPYTEQLALGEGQLDFRVFDLSVLEYYRNDPRYHYQTDFINGQISVTNEHYESESMPEHDQVLLQTFGFAHDKNLNRAVAVFLRYLSDLSPEHQAIWKYKELKGDYQLHPDYLRNSMGHWGTRISIFEAFSQEMQLINEMANLIGKPPLFRQTYEHEYPRNFGFLLRPTLAELNAFVLLLDQLMSDNLNKKFFSPELELEQDHAREDGRVEVRRKGTIALLDEWVHHYFQPENPEPLDRMIATFRKVRSLRQKPAHSIREDVFDQKYFRDQRSLIMDAYGAIRTLRLVLANHPNVKANAPKINKFLYEGKIWSI
ncbi:AAA family ATPase [Syntrophotalea acetylenivorans]|uniref:AAA family ATPase n=1 Tax=Syntrophotalea acetylenivorans TaxID=1842532 RepID=A0A1L3GM59_9BACT|nr:AAA family ATPase [Syntrophotalea acetylenivorans]APG27027.1 AAA family ATPase [Syntrophotalea acetylenivorans]